MVNEKIENDDYMKIVREAENILEHLEDLQDKIKTYSDKNKTLQDLTTNISELSSKLTEVCNQLIKTNNAFRKSGPEEISNTIDKLATDFKTIADTTNRIERDTSKILHSIDVLNEKVDKNLKRKGFLL